MDKRKPGRPSLGGTPLTVTVSRPTLQRIDRFAERQFATRLTAVRTVIDRGLDAVERGGKGRDK